MRPSWARAGVAASKALTAKRVEMTYPRMGDPPWDSGQWDIPLEDHEGRAARGLQRLADLCGAGARAARQERFEEAGVEVVRVYRDAHVEREPGPIKPPPVRQGEATPGRDARVGDFPRQVQGDLAPDRSLFSAAGDELAPRVRELRARNHPRDRKSTRLNSSHHSISYAVFCL